MRRLACWLWLPVLLQTACAADGVLLRRQHEPGTRYALTLNGTTVTTPLTETGRPTETRFEGGSVLRVESVDDAKVALVVEEQPRLRTSEDGGPFQDAPLARESSRSYVGARGEKYLPAEGGLKPATPERLPWLALLSGREIPLPEQRIKPGDRWKVETGPGEVEEGLRIEAQPVDCAFTGLEQQGAVAHLTCTSSARLESGAATVQYELELDQQLQTSDAARGDAVLRVKKTTVVSGKPFLEEREEYRFHVERQ